MGAIHSTKISGNFGLKLNGSVRYNGKSFERIRPPFQVDHFSRLDRSDRNGPFHLTIPIYSRSQDLAVRYLLCTKWRKILITTPLWIVNSVSIGVTRTCMCSKDRSVATSQAKCMFWLLTDLFPERIWNVIIFSSFDSNVVFEVILQISGNGLFKITRYTWLNYYE